MSPGRMGSRVRSVEIVLNANTASYAPALGLMSELGRVMWKIEK